MVSSGFADVASERSVVHRRESNSPPASAFQLGHAEATRDSAVRSATRSSRSEWNASGKTCRALESLVRSGAVGGVIWHRSLRARSEALARRAVDDVAVSLSCAHICLPTPEFVIVADSALELRHISRHSLAALERECPRMLDGSSPSWTGAASAARRASCGSGFSSGDSGRDRRCGSPGSGSPTSS